MKKNIRIIRLIVSTVIGILLMYFTLFGVIKGAKVNFLYLFKMIVCFLFDILMFRDALNSDFSDNITSSVKKSWVFFLIISGVVLSFIEIVMFYEEMVMLQETISSAIAAIASYTLFDSVNKYIEKNNV